jgi:hypothetical protein
VVAFYLLRYAQIGWLAVDRSADVTQAMSADIDRLTPVQTLELWSSEILKDGLGEAQTPIWVAAKGKLAEYLWWIKLGTGAIVAGILLSVGTLFVRRPRR